MNEDHNKIIAAAAKAALSPLGFKRKGRPRLWILDHGSWLNVVGFKPSRWSVSAELENSAHWIWAGAGFMSLNYLMANDGSYVKFENRDQFSEEIAEISQKAAARAIEIEETFPSFEAIATYSIKRATENERMRPSWFGYYAGVASGLLGDLRQAEHFLRGVTDERVVPRAQRFISVLANATQFTAKANEVVAQQRVALRLAPLEADAF